ncbi:MAG: S8 family serine peptidase [Flavobacteriales bacterium]
MKKIYFACISILLSSSLLSQNKISTLKVDLKNGTQFYPINIESFVSSKTNRPIIEGRYYRFVQFASIPSQENKEAMMAQGLRFQEYIPMNTYLVSFPKDFDKNSLEKFGAQSVMEILNSDRITDMALSTPYPEWAIEEDEVVLYISFYQDLDFESQIEKLQPYISRVKSKNEFVKKTLVVVNKNNVTSLFNHEGIRMIDLTPEPGKPEHDLSRNMHRSTSINTRYNGGRKYDGTGVVVAVNDDGIVGPHIDFTGRITQPGVTADLGSHGDMVAGIVGGAGNVDPTMKGMATGADIIIRQYSSSLPNTVNVHTNSSAVIFSSSYSNGCNAGYTSLARTVDQEIRLNPSLIQVFSAGNSNNNNCGYGAGTQWGNITGGHKQAKNVIATANLETGTNLATSSSRGPADDGRIKPDIAAHGNGNYSTDPNNTYAYGSGTSAAAPGISGVLAQMYHAYETKSGVRPESGLMKAIILNSADDFGNVGPDFKYGFGRVNALRAIRAIEQTRYFDSTITTGNTNSHNIVIPANVAEVKVMVYWHDYEASTSATKALVNNLDAKLELGITTFLPWILDPTPNATTLDNPATKGIDTLNNVEQISINNPVAGTYSLKVNGLSVPQGPQKYYVTYEFIYDDVELINPNGGEGFVPGVTERLFWDSYGTNGNFSLSYSIDSGANWTNIGTSAGTATYRDWAVPNVATGKAMVRVIRGSLGDTSDHTFSIIRIPTNLTVTQVCPTFMEVSWTAVTGADEYEVYVLGNKYMDSVGRTSATSFQIPITDPTLGQWFSVAAIKSNSQNNVGRRADAQFYAGGLLNCVLPLDGGISALISPTSSACVSGLSGITVQVENFGATTVSNFPVKYRVNGGAIQTGSVSTSLTTGNSTAYTFPVQYNFGATGAYIIEAWTEIPGDLYSNNDTATVIYNYTSTQTAPFFENFNSFTNCSEASDCESVNCTLRNGFYNMENLIEDDIDWRTNSGSTISNGTGPSGDHTSGFGKYLYLEASGTCTEKTADMLSPCIDLGTSISTPFMSFWYHMYGGNSMDTLRVDVFNGTTWYLDQFKIGGNQGNQWKKGLVDLTAFSGDIIRLRFSGTTGGNWDTDIAIDDINISDHTTIQEDELNSAVSIYPNPNNGEFDLTIDNAKINDVNVTIFDVYGRMVYSNTLTNKINRIQLDNIASGVYSVRITSKDQTVTKKIIIN